MSIQNILVENNLTLYCKELEIEGQMAPNSQTQTISLDIYYNDVVVHTQSFIFQKIEVPGQNGICAVKITHFNVPVSVASRFYVNISSVTNFLIDSIQGDSTVLAAVVNNSVNAYGKIATDPSNQRIYIANAFNTNFSSTGTAGLKDDYILVYRTAAV
ncbi:hypothetical protein A2V49_02150 [candidate division WWE3 bacterium RBG_19FT_COMBO_34_6]|uniref:Uncharacterized protein n=1 Tax=candidate division WWE3 bacterium RBG_19FT_COMBO_34_6 TaxID=1802612 RepID=A0A1F4UL87_UNCKA|nr:MAG: hypothetical protein A2V49_02150 [candidate division WWE3 bacterium RBG_19FT_COMBO_34_6]